MNYSLSTLLKRKSYVRIPLKKVASGHYICTVVLNGISGDFIVDTGASHTCVAWDKEAYFKLNAHETEQQAASASSTKMETRHSHENVLKIGKWTCESCHLASSFATPSLIGLGALSTSVNK